MSTLTPEAEEQIMALRDMTRRTGVLHEIQALNLSNWAKLAIPQMDYKKFTIEFPNTTVEFAFKGDPAHEPKNMAARYRALLVAVQWLLGADWRVRVKHGAKIVFKGDPAKKVV